MKITKERLKHLIKEELEENGALLKAIGDLSNRIEGLDVSIDYLAASITGEDPAVLGYSQSALGRYARRPPPPRTPEPSQVGESETIMIATEKLKQLIGEELAKEMQEQMLAEKMPESWGRAAKLLGLGAALASATYAGGEYASHAQEIGQQADAFRSAMQVSAEKVKSLNSFMDIAQLPDAAGAAVGEPVGDTKQAMEDFQYDHHGDWNNAGDVIAGGFGLPQETFGFVPADQIGDNEVLPFVGLTKADYETLLRAFYLDDPGGKGDQRLEDLVMGGKPGSSMYWAYGGGGEPLFSFFDAGADSGDRGMMLPPEWSVAYDLLQTRQAKGSGAEMPAAQQDLGIPLDAEQDLSIPLNQTSWNEWKKMIKKELAKLL